MIGEPTEPTPTFKFQDAVIPLINSHYNMHGRKGVKLESITVESLLLLGLKRRQIVRVLPLLVPRDIKPVA